MAVYKVTAREVDPASALNLTTIDLLGTKITGSPKVTTTSVIRYFVKLFEDDGTTPITRPINLFSNPVGVHWSVTGSSVKHIVWNDYFQKMGGAHDVNANSNWVADIKATGQSTIVPTFTVTLDGDPVTLSGSVPTPIFTLAPVSKVPALPTKINTDIKATDVLSEKSDVYVNPCPGATSNFWAVHIIKGIKVTPNSAYSSYSHTINFYKKDGSAGDVSKPFGVDKPVYTSSVYDSAAARGLTSKTGEITAYAKALKYLVDFKAGLLCASDTKAMANPGGTDPKSKTYTGPRWNPPNHINTRGDSHGERITGGMQLKDVRLGYIYSDNNYKSNTFMSSTAQSPNSANAEWGFRFHYNPAEISYNTLAMLQTDVQLMSKDPTQMVPGNTTITLGLVLNRQLDMSLLDKDNPERDRWSSYYPKDPVRGSLTEDQLNNFWTRGTEYDLEFFYRIVTGFEPSSRSLLKNGDLTSDLGFLTVQPFWITFHDNMTYFCKMTGIDVTHKAFTKDMVPYLTEVTLSMTRMVTPELDITKTKNKVISSSHVSSWKGNTGPAATGGIGP